MTTNKQREERSKPHIKDETFKILDVHYGWFGNDIDIRTSNGQKYQIAVDKEVRLESRLIGKYVKLKYTKDDRRYYFNRIDYALQVI